MKCICITGAIQSDLDAVSDILRQAGMKLPKAANRGESINIASWHDQAVIMDSEETESGYTVVNPGRFMEQLAADIFVANNKSNFWGWADVRSTWLLDFWLNFDPRLYFVFVCVSPEQMLANAMSSKTEIDSVAGVMDAWQAHYQQLLRFHLRNPLRSLLVDANECIENPYLLTKRCAEQWKLKIDEPVIADIPPIAHDSLSLYLAQQLCKGYPKAASLQHELAASVSHLGEIEKAVNSTALSPEHIVSDYRFLRDRSVEQGLLQAAREELEIYVLKHESQQKQIEALQGEIATLSVERQAEIDRLIKKHNGITGDLKGEVAALVTVRDEQSSLVIKHQATIEQLTKQHSDTIAGHAQQLKDAAVKLKNVEVKLKNAEQENESLLLQLHTLVTARDEQSSLALKHQATIEQLTKKHTDTIAVHAQQLKDAAVKLKNAEQENESLLLQLHALVTARDEQSSLALKHQATIEQLTKQHTDTIAGHAQQLKDAAVKIENVEAKLENVEVNFKNAEQENELLLLQLHQVQEELEYYFLQYQDKQKELQDMDARWQRMLRRNPDYLDFDYNSIEVLPVEDKECNAAIWRLKNLNIAGRNLSEIEFKTIIEQDVLGFVFSRHLYNAGMFTRWPDSSENQNEFTIIPIGKDDSSLKFNSILGDFTTSDWELLNLLIRLLENALQHPQKLLAPAEFNSGELGSGLGKLRESIERIPAMLRYDQVVLKSEQVSSDSEHLWLRLNNLSFGNKRWPEFEFRFACAPISPDGFGNYPRLQFPEEVGQAPFEAWFIESYDDFGAKLEWRFALPEAMDVDVWQRISENDRDFLSALVARLPVILSILQNTGIALNRPWEEWINMAKEIQRVLAIRVAHQVASAVSQTPADLEENIPPLTDVAAPVELEQP